MNRLKRQVLPCILVIICILNIFALKANYITGSVSAGVSISINDKSYALLPILSGIGGKLYRGKTTESDIPKGMALQEEPVAFFLLPWHFYSGHFANFSYVNSPNIIFKRGGQQTYLLLDIPPPSDMVSTRF